MMELPYYHLIRQWIGNDHVGIGVSNHWEAEEDALFPEETKLLSQNAVEKRKKEFILGRIASRKALEQLHYPRLPILRGKGREPLWPDTLVGSITHSQQTAIAIVAERSSFMGIGIDLEVMSSSFKPSISRMICTESEQHWIARQQCLHEIYLFQLFSAKEAIFKAFYPMEFVSLNFKDVELCWDQEKQGFRGILRVRAAELFDVGSTFFVHSRVRSNYVFSWIALPTYKDNKITQPIYGTN